MFDKMLCVFGVVGEVDELVYVLVVCGVGCRWLIMFGWKLD